MTPVAYKKVVHFFLEHPTNEHFSGGEKSIIEKPERADKNHWAEKAQ
jgi:hypothetical protein